jgi:hypothetical protein
MLGDSVSLYMGLNLGLMIAIIAQSVEDLR